jgi:hypothetical protein
MNKIEKCKFFYEAMWFGDDKGDSPIIRGKSIDKIVKPLIDLTRGKSGYIEVYKIEYNNLGHKIGLIQKFHVLDEVEIEL